MDYRWDELRIAQLPLLMNYLTYNITLYDFFKVLSVSLGLIALSFYYSDDGQFYDILFYWVDQPVSYLYVVLILSKALIYDRLWRKYLIDNDCLTLNLRQKATDFRVDDLRADYKLSLSFCGFCLWSAFIFIVSDILLAYQISIKVPLCFIFALFLIFAVSKIWYYILRYYHLYKFIKDIKESMAEEQGKGQKEQ